MVDDSESPHEGPEASIVVSDSLPPTISPPDSLTRGFVGLALVGWGFSIIFQITPHEAPFVGFGLLAFGVALIATAPRLPRAPRLRAPWVAAIGFAIVTLIIGHAAWTKASVDTPKIAILAWGTSLAACAPILNRGVRIGTRNPRRISVSRLVGYSLPLMGAPLFAWGVQAAFKGASGVTPTELFVRYALLVPLQFFLSMLGWQPRVDGQSITYSMASGERIMVDVGAACSGIQAMALFGGVLALYLFTQRPDAASLAFWATAGLAGVYITNLIRLAALTSVGHVWGGPALERAHAEAGWVFFVAWAVLFAWLARSYSAPMRPGPAQPPLTAS